MSFKARPDSARTKVREFFDRNPHEELSYQDLIVKFDLTKGAARSAVMHLTRSGVIESQHIIRRKQ